MKQEQELKEFIDKLLSDYDLIEADKSCLNNISGALLDATLWDRKIYRSAISKALADAYLKYGDYVEVQKALSIIAQVNNN